MACLSILCTEYAPFRGGIGVYAEQLSRAAAALGHEVTVHAPDYLGAARPGDGVGPGMAVVRYRAGPYSARWHGTYLRVALSVARTGWFDRLFAADAGMMEALALTQPFHRHDFDAALHGSEVLRAGRGAKGLAYRPKWTFGRARRLYPNSRATARLLEQRMPWLERSRVEVAPLGVGARWFEPADPAGLRAMLGLGERRVIACVGRVSPRKNQLALIEAAAQLPPEAAGPRGLSVVIAGRPGPADGPWKARLAAAAAAAAPLQVVFAEDLGDDAIRSLHAASDLFCLPGTGKTASVEGFGLVLLEAAAQGVPAVAGDVGGVGEALADGETGLLVPPDSAAALTGALAALLRDEDRRRRMGEAARDRARAFSWDACARTIFGPARGDDGRGARPGGPPPEDPGLGAVPPTGPRPRAGSVAAPRLVQAEDAG